MKKMKQKKWEQNGIKVKKDGILHQRFPTPMVPYNQHVNEAEQLTVYML